MERHPTLLRRDDSVLVVVDAQESLLPILHGSDALLANLLLLCRSAAILGVPVLATTQYAARLGPTVAPIAEALAEAGSPEPFDKLSFSCAGSEAFVAALAATGRRQVVLCGAETHICVSQTAHDLKHAGYAVHVVADAVSSRTLERHKLGMERIRDGGILPCAAEAAVYEWMQVAGTPEFKAILKMVR
jgi:Amidases related to nicotinamidase